MIPRDYITEWRTEVPWEQFEQNMDARLSDPQFTADNGPLLATGQRYFSSSRLPGPYQPGVAREEGCRALERFAWASSQPW